MTGGLLLVAAALLSPEVHPDRRVTFRLSALKSSEVKLWGEWISRYNTTEPMQKDAGGVWSVTIGPLPPNLYLYLFLADGVPVPDPANPLIQPGREGAAGSLVDIPGPIDALYKPQPGPKGTLHTHGYDSSTGLGLRNVIVYTPPGYDSVERRRYPVLYLYHGSGDTECNWTQTGRAHAIADNLIAKGKLRPLLIVMPNGHAPGPKDIEQVRDDLRRDLIPFVDAHYRTVPNRSGRAIAGLSKGAFQALWYGLDHPELFSGIGVFSGGVIDENGENQIARFAGKKQPVAPIWVAIGERDRNLPFARRLDRVLTTSNLPHEFRIVPGAGHTWPFWRQELAEMLPALFPKAK